MDQNIKNILVTGNMGYIGSVLAPILIREGYEVTGYDIGFYGDDCLLYKEEALKYRQMIKDIRDISMADLEGIDAVVHLAALSNDPLGELDPKFTEEINLKATLQLAECAKKAGVKRFVYSSSQSMYGISKTVDELDEESPKEPLTAYARTKWEAECGLKKMNSDDFTVVCFRPSTVFGVSPRFRSDIVFNNLVGCAYTTEKIEVKSDGTPWRPVIHVIDACRAFIAGIRAPARLISGQSFNVGIANGNYTVRDLAEAAKGVVPESTLTFTGEHGNDSRTYKVSFKKILSALKDYYKPKWDLRKGGKELVDLFKKVNFSEEQFRGRTCNRLKQIKHLIQNQKIGEDLRRMV